MYEINGFKLRIPVVGSPMFTISNPKLVVNQCKSGIIGSFPALNAREPETLEDWIKKIKDDLEDYKFNNPDKIVAPYAVNQICHKSNKRLISDMETCVEQKVPIIITSLRPPDDIIDAAHSYGGIVYHDVISVRHAEKAAEIGVDGLILVCAGAGGHAGTLSPFALLREVKEWFKGTILLSGSIGDGNSIASALALGADLAYIGSRFIATSEANADEVYKKMILDSSAKDIVYSSFFSGVHGNYLRGSIERSGLDPDNLEDGSKNQMTFSNPNKPKTWKDIWGSGQGIGRVSEITSTEKVVDQLEKELKNAINDLKNRTKDL
ncbi:MAG: nitronate monooxygenase [SAR202 cluster bacterium]|nr:nitronate monooxygenase [Chloroflexota bacterium]MED5237933.1 nitronate monooxygenase family protein [Chloroflexota bacterium]MQG23691.1 nitronate monooxygenase [SAR202 cluster bacterium]MQG43548.1 nitronate monooxygenase [SAR202 cluster bacterium]|tara:strand:- start:6870 stop:7835 length:966 start_codon:yes stop_codon:yes gene_type:complete